MIKNSFMEIREENIQTRRNNICRILGRNEFGLFKGQKQRQCGWSVENKRM